MSSQHRNKIHSLLTRVNALYSLEGFPEYDEGFFDKYPQFVNIRFFLVNRKAPTGPENITRYVRFMKALETGGIEKNIDYVIESFKFIRTYCDKHGIGSDKYPDHIPSGRSTEAFWVHLKDRWVSPYALTFFPTISQKILTSDQDEYRYYLENISGYVDKLAEVASKTNIKQQLLKTKNKILT